MYICFVYIINTSVYIWTAASLAKSRWHSDFLETTKCGFCQNNAFLIYFRLVFDQYQLKDVHKRKNLGSNNMKCEHFPEIVPS